MIDLQSTNPKLIPLNPQQPITNPKIKIQKPKIKQGIIHYEHNRYRCNLYRHL